MHFLAQKSASTLEVDALFGSLRLPCSLRTAALLPARNLLKHFLLPNSPACFLPASLKPPCSLLATSLRHPCSLLMHFLAQKSASTLEFDVLFSYNVPPWSILAASLCTSLLKKVRQPLKLTCFLVPVGLLVASLPPACSLRAAFLKASLCT